MRPNGVYVASFGSIAYSTAGTIIEIQASTGPLMVEVWRAWIGPAEGTDPVDEVQEIALYVNDAATTSGTAMSENELQGSADAAATAVAVRGGTIGATPTNLIFDAFHTQNGWLYLPAPEERPRIHQAATDDNIGLQFPVAPDQSMTFSGGIVWAEYG